MEKKEPKKLSLSKEEQRALSWRHVEKSKHEYIAILIGNDIVDYIKNNVYKRLGLDPSKDYPLDETLENILVDNETKIVLTK